MTTATSIPNVLSEDELRRISRSIRSFIPSGPSATDSSIENQLKHFRALLNNVFYTSARSGLTQPHRVAAWNTLCSLIDQSRESIVPEASALIWTESIWERAFELYLSHAQTARPKSSRQLLVTLADSLRKCRDRGVVEVKQHATERLIGCLIDYESPHAAKLSAQLIGQLLSKDVLSLHDVLLSLDRYQLRFDLAEAPYSVSGSNIQDMLEVALRWLAKGDFGSTVAQLLSILLDKTDISRSSSGHPIWLAPLQKALQGNTVDIDNLRVHILPVLFRRDFKDFVLCLQALGLDLMGRQSRIQAPLSPVNQQNLLFAALQTGKEVGLLQETEDIRFSRTTTAVFVPTRFVGELLSCRSRSARLTGLSLLITSHSATKPIPSSAIKLIKRALGILFADVDADFRSDVFGAFQRLIERIRGASAILARGYAATSVAGSEPASMEGDLQQRSERALKRHRDLLAWVIRFLAWELRPTASYQRHISALKCLSTVAKSGLDRRVSSHALSKSALGETRWPFHLTIMSASLHRMLVDLVLNPFDDVRQSASAILKIYASADDQAYTMAGDDALTVALSRAEIAMLNSGRADQADGVAHIYALHSWRHELQDRECKLDPPRKTVMIEELISKLQKTIQIAQIDLSEAVRRFPVHGLLTSIRYILSQHATHAHQDVKWRLFELLKQVWAVVKLVLCNDAPEGYMPEEFEQPADSTKETLSYCWRALKEASLLLGALMTGQQGSTNRDSLLLAMSDLCFTQLAELRHRGAFSTVAQTWTTCCIICRDLWSQNGVTVLMQYYARMMNLLRDSVTINTRRSAGLPALLCGIIIAERSGTLLDQAFKELEDVARQDVKSVAAAEGSLPQVHAINCLKDLLKNTRLGEQSGKHVPVSLKLAADALQSEVWAIRNCGLMLFRAVIDRLLGTDQSYLEGDIVTQMIISAEEYPELLDVILGLLPQEGVLPESASLRYEGVFPALQLLSHTRLPDTGFIEVLNAVRGLTGCSSWHVRDKAARTIASLLMPKHRESFIADSLDVLGLLPSASHNMLHGNLLVAKYVFQAVGRVVEQHREMQRGLPHNGYVAFCRNFLQSDFSKFLIASTCFVIQAAVLDCLRECLKCLTVLDHALEERKSHHRWLTSCLHNSLKIKYDSDSISSYSQVYSGLLSLCLTTPAAAQLRQATARLLAQLIVYEEASQGQDVSVFVASVMALATHDQDAGKHFLIALDLNRLRAFQSARDVVFELANKILEGNFGTAIMCEAQTVLIEVLSANSTAAQGGGLMETASGAPALALHDSNQRFADQSLQLQAIRLDNEASRGEYLEHKVVQEITNWVSDCMMAVQNTGIHTREAAAGAFSRIHFLWMSMSSQEELTYAYLMACIMLYDLLNDDDEDLRLVACNAVTRILKTDASRPLQPLEPIVAGQKLLGYLVRRWPDNSRIATMAIERAFGVSDKVCVPIRDQLASLSEMDTALFAQEKQNLYIDEAREVRVWSQVLQRLSPRALPRALTTKLAWWVSSGLQALADQAQNRDGPLGWTSNADVFTLGLQVIYGAEVLLYWVREGLRLPVQPSYIRKQLFQCSIAFHAGEVNGLWLREVERILSDAVLDKLLLARQLLSILRD